MSRTSAMISAASIRLQRGQRTPEPFDMTDAELLLLSKFWVAQPREYVRGRAAIWGPVLGRPPMDVIDEFLRNGLLNEADLPTALDSKFRAKELEAMLRARGLKVSGTKIVKIARLIEAHATEMTKLVQNFELLLCTEQGRMLVDDFLARQVAEKSRAKSESFAALEAGDFHLASNIVTQFHAKQIFGAGSGTFSLSSEHTHTWMVRRLELIAKAMPRIIATAKPESLPYLRRAAQIMELWGEKLAETWLPTRLETGLRLDAITAARMISFYVYNKLRLQGTSDPDLARFVKGVRISGISDESRCPECAALDGKLFSPDEVPELPYEHCTSEGGCRCLPVVLVVGDDS